MDKTALLRRPLSMASVSLLHRVLLVTILFVPLVFSTVAVGVLAGVLHVRMILPESNIGGGPVVSLEAAGYVATASVTGNSCEVTFAGGARTPHRLIVSDGLVVNWCIQAIARLSDKHLFFYW